MNYFYDLLINLNDEVAYRFFEWNKDDNIIHLKKIPIFKISHHDLKTFLNYNIQVDQDFLDSIYNKTESYEKKAKYILYMALFTDENNTIVIEFNEKGKSIARSYLLLEEELDLLEMAYTLKKEEISYQKLKPIIQDNEVRQIREMQKFLNVEIDSLYEEKNLPKMRYLYNEILSEDEKDFEKLYQGLKKVIQSEFSDYHLRLLEIIKLSYNHLSL